MTEPFKLTGFNRMDSGGEYLTFSRKVNGQGIGRTVHVQKAAMASNLLDACKIALATLPDADYRDTTDAQREAVIRLKSVIAEAEAGVP